MQQVDPEPEEAAPEVDACGPAWSEQRSRQLIRSGLDGTPSAPVLQAEFVGDRQIIKFLEDQVEDLRSDRDDLRGDRDGWRQQAETAQRLLTHARETTAAPEPVRP
ncbi:MAG: hypothetical protein GY798_20070 [Hyphomicrobiales bacterium]|nr:hypothetical protein [Hyphomicrobiales bacterium]